MTRHDRMVSQLQSLNPIYVRLIDESHKHAGHVEHLGDRVHEGQTHYKLVLVTDRFDNLNRIDRQRLVNDCLKSEFANGLHALTMKLYTKNEHEKVIIAELDKA